MGKIISLVFAFALFITSAGYSQSPPQEEPSREIRQMARADADFWSTELGLTEKQEILMEKKITEFAIKKKVLLQSKMQEEAKAVRLLELQQEENRDMKDILTRPQYSRYLVIQKERLKEPVKIKN